MQKWGHRSAHALCPIRSSIASVAVVFRIHHLDSAYSQYWRELLCDFVEGNYPTLAGWWHVLRRISIYVIADAGMVSHSVLKQFGRIVRRFRLDDGDARIVEVGGNAGVFNGVSGHKLCGVCVSYLLSAIGRSMPILIPALGFLHCPVKRTHKQAE